MQQKLRADTIEDGPLSRLPSAAMPRQTKLPHWIEAADARLRRFCGSDRALLSILRFAAVPLALILLLMLYAVIF